MMIVNVKTKLWLKFFFSSRRYLFLRSVWDEIWIETSFSWIRFFYDELLTWHWQSSQAEIDHIGNFSAGLRKLNLSSAMAVGLNMLLLAGRAGWARDFCPVGLVEQSNLSNGLDRTESSVLRVGLGAQGLSERVARSRTNPNSGLAWVFRAQGLGWKFSPFGLDEKKKVRSELEGHDSTSSSN
jgi:hypothetical protein